MAIPADPYAVSTAPPTVPPDPYATPTAPPDPYATAPHAAASPASSLGGATASVSGRVTGATPARTPDVESDFNKAFTAFGQGGIRPQFKTVVNHITGLGYNLGLWDFSKGHHYAPGDPHLDGRAMDVDTINGQGVGGALTPLTQRFVEQALAADPNVRVGLGGQLYDHFAKQFPGRVFSDEPTHIHVELGNTFGSAQVSGTTAPARLTAGGGLAPTAPPPGNWLQQQAAAVGSLIDGNLGKLVQLGERALTPPTATDPKEQARQAAYQSAAPIRASAVAAYANIVPAPVRERLSGVLQRFGQAADIPYDAVNAALRDLGGDHANGLLKFAAGAPPIPPPNPFSPAAALIPATLGVAMPLAAWQSLTSAQTGAYLDRVAREFGFNSPGDITYWANQPGVMQRIMTAKPQDPLGMMLQVGLGMHADYAQLKPYAPYQMGLETAAAEMVNPSYVGFGRAGAFLKDSAADVYASARAGAFGKVTQRLAQAVGHAPIVGNRFAEMYDAGGPIAEWKHSELAANHQMAPHAVQARWTSQGTYGGANQGQQFEIMDMVEDPLGAMTGKFPNAGRVIGNLTMLDRAKNIANLWRTSENRLMNADPEMADRFNENVRHGHDGLWQLPQGQTSSQFPLGPIDRQEYSPGGVGVTSGVMGKGRVYNTRLDGLDAGLQQNPDAMPSAMGAQHDVRMERYSLTAEWIKSLDAVKTRAGQAMRQEIEYRYPLANGTIQVIGSGRAGYERMLKLTKAHAEQAAFAEATARGAANGFTQEQIEATARNLLPSKQRVEERKVRDLWLSSGGHDEFDFNPADRLGMPMLKGYTLHNAAVKAVLDSHPAFYRNPIASGAAKVLGVKHADEQNPQALHMQDVLPEYSLGGWVDMVNSAVRQGILGMNPLYHPSFNLIPLLLNEGVDHKLIARAMMMDRNNAYIPKAWIDRAHAYKAGAPNFGNGVSLNPTTRAKIMTVPYHDLSNPVDKMTKAFVQASRWNQDITFGYFEDRLSGVAMRHYENQGMGPEAAARKVRTVLGDYQNMTPVERAAGMRNWQYFYQWMRGQLRYWTGNVVQHPQNVMAPVRGVQTANQLQGDEGSVPGGALSMRALFGTDPQGNPYYVGLPLPQLRYGTDVMRMMGSAVGGDPNEAASVTTNMVLNHLPPMASIAIQTGITAASTAGQPQSYNHLLWDKDAPSPGVKFMQAAAKIGQWYAPGALRAPIEATAKHEPVLGLGALGPSAYSSPNTGTPQSKLQYTTQKNLHALYLKAKESGDPNAGQMYDLLQRVQDGDPLAVQEASAWLRNQQRLKAMVRPPSLSLP